ncbi:diacylglycerol/lipid kinase family protein [Flaviflexus massiliensis]|uniref:diacylglycerol/lipid kinase family protein n=1 Tax=Flaviflexus massiliensis TaxID=1522309 RepID=UPI0006D56ABB|nr:diacylglycerol kinase family protein [Flaviflexus massiliensis]
MDSTLGFVISPTAGNGRGTFVGRTVRDRLLEAGHRVIPLGAPTHEETSALLESALDAGELDGIVTMGGDGTIHLAIQHLVGRDVFLGHVPFGTGSDIARDLGLTTSWDTGLDILIEALNERQPGTIDALEITGSHGVSYGMAVVSAGVDAIVNQAANTYSWPHGHSRYLRAVLAKLPGYRPRTYRIEHDGKQATGEAILIAVANTKSFGGGLTISPDSDPFDGKLELLMAKKLSLLEVADVLPRLYEGTHVEKDFVHVHDVTEVRLDTIGEGVVAMVDGEEIGPLPVTVRVRPRALRILR